MKNITRLGLFVALGSAVLAACSSLSSSPVGGEQVTGQVVIDNGDILITSSALGKPLTVAEKTAMVTAKQVVHTFSNGKTYTFYNRDGDFDAGGGILVARAKDLGNLIQKAEDDLTAKNTFSSQGTGLNPTGCSSWFLWSCSYSTSNFIWPSKAIPFAYEASLSFDQKFLIQYSIDRWNATSSNVKWRYRNGNESFVSFNLGDKCNSYVGNQKFTQGVLGVGNYSGQRINLTAGCIAGGDRYIHHEMGHAAGLWHEQQRCDRDSYVVVTGGGDVDYGKRCGADARDYGYYNYKSVMHYNYDGIVTKKTSGLGPNYNGIPDDAGNATGLEQGDVSALNTIYP